MTEQEKKELIAEARGCVCNALAAYTEAFEIVDKEELNEEFFSEIESLLMVMESMVPMFKTLWELDKRENPDETFLEFMEKVLDKRG